MTEKISQTFVLTAEQIALIKERAEKLEVSDSTILRMILKEYFELKNATATVNQPTAIGS